MNSNLISLPFTSSSFYSSSNIPFLKSPLISRRPIEPRVNAIAAINGSEPKIVVVMGGTGCGKSGLSVQLGSNFPSEIINSDKMQVYNGLDITTNKIPLHERHDVPHHILGDVVSDEEFTPFDFRLRANNVVSEIVSRNNLPILVGGSNSFIHAMLVNHFNPNDDVFSNPKFISSDFRYRCCFLWLDVAFPILSQYLSIRVDDMLKLGMYEELAEFYDPNVAETASYNGVRKAIGVPEFDKYFKIYPPTSNKKSAVNYDEVKKSAAFEEAVNEIKMNTHVLAETQIEKILKLKRAGWDINVLNATDAVRAVVEPGTGRNREEIWRKQVLEPGLRIVKHFLEE